ncbi:LYR motif-containing protein 9, partial [Bienertia sinuspersici]
ISNVVKKKNLHLHLNKKQNPNSPLSSPLHEFTPSPNHHPLFSPSTAAAATSLNEKFEMPSLQSALPPELANNTIRLYRECLRRAKYIGNEKYNTELLVDMVRQQFKKHMYEKDPEKIQKLKDDAARGLINHMLHESERLSGRKFSKS